MSHFFILTNFTRCYSMLIISTRTWIHLNRKLIDWIWVHAWVRTSCLMWHPVLFCTTFLKKPFSYSPPREIQLNLHDQTEMPIPPWTFYWFSSIVTITQLPQHSCFSFYLAPCLKWFLGVSVSSLDWEQSRSFLSLPLAPT